MNYCIIYSTWFALTIYCIPKWNKSASVFDWMSVGRAAAVVIIVIIAFAIAIVLPFRYADATTGPQDTFIRATFRTYVGVTPVRCRWLVSGVSWARRQIMHTTRGTCLHIARTQEGPTSSLLFVVLLYSRMWLVI
jgi:hypothetical protein